VLDEATSLLDAELESEALAAVPALGCSTLMITHRENVARTADTVVVLDGGCVIDAGPIEAVARPGSPYDRLGTSMSIPKRPSGYRQAEAHALYAPR
jgi:ABC-type bacteriocin/lantibiotic exporter with double-glycine peptidase domain